MVIFFFIGLEYHFLNYQKIKLGIYLISYIYLYLMMMPLNLIFSNLKIAVNSNYRFTANQNQIYKEMLIKLVIFQIEFYYR